MKKLKFSSISVLIISLFFLAIIGCGGKTGSGNDSTDVAADLANLVDTSIQGSNADLSNVIGNLTFPAVGENGSTITWSSDTPAVIADDGTVARPSGVNATVIITATFTKGSVTKTKTFTVIVLNTGAILYTVTYDSELGTSYGTSVSAQIVASGSKLTKPPDPGKDDSSFTGWYKEEACTSAWNFSSDTVTANRTLYAKWIAATSELTYTAIGSTAYSVKSDMPFILNGSVIIPAYHLGLPVTTIDDDAFYGADRMTDISIPNTVTTIGANAFRQCTELTSFVIPNGVTVISNGAFQQCEKLATITIPVSVTTIGESTFSGSGLTTISIPDGVAAIGSYAFLNCASLTTVTVNRPAPITTAGSDIFSSCILLTAIKVPGADVDTYKAASGWDTYISIIVPIATQALANSESAKITVATLGSLGKGGNVVAKAQTLVSGYMVSIVSSSNLSAISSSGTLIGAVGTTSRVVFRVTKDGFTADTSALTLTVAAGWGCSPVLIVEPSTYTYNPLSHQIAIDASGNAIVVWRQYDSGGIMSVYLSRYTASTGLWSIPSKTSIDSATDPKIAMNDSGNAVVVWSQNDGTQNNLWANCYTKSTDHWGTAALIETSPVNADGYQVAIDPSGNVVAVWHQPSNGKDSIWSNYYTVSTGLWSNAVLLETQNTYTAYFPQIALDTSGNGVAVWWQSDETIWSNRCNSSGTWGAAKQIQVNPGANANQKVAIDTSGNAIAVWSQISSGKRSILYSRCTLAGIWDAPALLETSDTDTANNPQIAIDSSKNVVVIWEQRDSTCQYIWSNRYTASTASWSGAVKIMTDSSGDAYSPMFSIGGDGNAIAVWHQRDSTNRNNVWSNRCSSSGVWGTAELIENNDAGDAYSPQIAINTSGNGFAVWIQNVLANGKDLIYSNMFTAP